MSYTNKYSHAFEVVSSILNLECMNWIDLLLICKGFCFVFQKEFRKYPEPSKQSLYFSVQMYFH